jgi:hypothetical protein
MLLSYDGAGVMNFAWIYGADGREEGTAIAQASNGGFYLGGSTNGYSSELTDILLIKTDSLGRIPNCPECTLISPLTPSQSIGHYTISGIALGPSPASGLLAPYLGAPTLSEHAKCDGLVYIYLPLVEK